MKITDLRKQLRGEEPSEDSEVVKMLHFPNVGVKLVGVDGNAFVIIGKVVRALKKAGASQDEIDKYKAEAKSGDYDNLLQVTMRWVDVF